MNFETDLADKISESELRDLLIKSRKRNRQGSYTMRPVHYKGRTYWNINHAIHTETENRVSEEIKKYAIIFCIGCIIYIFGMYKIASQIIDYYS